MSRLSSKSLRLEIGPERLRVALLGRWPRRHVRAAVERSWRGVSASEEPGSAAAEPHSAISAALHGAIAELAEKGSLAGMALDVVLPDTLAHFDIAQGRFGAHGEPQLRAIAAACVKELLDEQSGQYEIRFQLQSDEQHLLLCAVPIGMLNTIRAAAAQADLRIRSIEPLFARQWNRHGGALRRGLGVFAVGDDGYATIALVRHGVVQALSSGSCCDPSEEAHAPSADGDRLPTEAGVDQVVSPCRLDAKVNRLLASLGVDAAELKRLVAIDGSCFAQLSPRWTVLRDVGVST
ncbi:MAG: hypothetical protein WA210_13575 [Burkholderiaceae bacterium]